MLGYLITGCTVVALPIFAVIEVPPMRWTVSHQIFSLSYHQIYLDINTLVITMELYVKVGRRYSDTADLLTTLIRPSKQWGPNHYQAKILTERMKYLLQAFPSRLAKMTELNLKHQTSVVFQQCIRSLKSK